jgi:hypothetical protein
VATNWLSLITTLLSGGYPYIGQNDSINQLNPATPNVARRGDFRVPGQLTYPNPSNGVVNIPVNPLLQKRTLNAQPKYNPKPPIDNGDPLLKLLQDLQTRNI